MIKAAIYVRVSTDKQELENQRRQLIAFCERSGWEVFKIYSDIISGSKEQRPGFSQMFRDAHKKLFDVVLFWDLSRFSRSGVLYTLEKLKELEYIGIRWKSYNEPYIDSGGVFKDVVVSMLAAVAQIEREKISERTKAGLERARAEGKRLGRPKVRDEVRDKVMELWNQGKSKYRISKELGISTSTVFHIVNSFENPPP